MDCAMKVLLPLIASAGSILGCYLPPVEGVQLFRRDVLPLDSNRQILLAKDLLALAARPDALEDASQRRATAQLLALASNLDPSSATPSNLNRTFAAGEEDDIVASSDMGSALDNLSTVLVYLLGDDATREQKIIAELMLDPLAVVAPDLNIVSARQSGGESPRWHRVIAPMEKFEEQPEVDLPPPVEPEMANPGEEATEEETAKDELLQVADFQGEIIVPAILGERISNKEYLVHERLQPLTLIARLQKEQGKVDFPVGRDSKTLPPVRALVKENLERRYSPETIKRIQANFRLGKVDYLDRNGLTLALPMIILAEGFLSERQPLGNLVVLGALDSEGQIKAPKSPWQFLDLLLSNPSESPRRILISHELGPQMEALLTRQQEDFFFDNDVFQVKTLDDVFELAFEGAESEAARSALEQFAEIRRVGASKTTSVFVANPHVLARLGEARRTDPRMLSASLLEMRGSSNQPLNHSTEVLASLLQSALLPMSKLPYANSRHLEASKLEQIHSDCREALDPIARNVSLGDRKLYDQGLDLANRIRTLARAKERYDKEEFPSNESFHVSLFYSTFQAIQKEYFDFASEVAIILKQEPPADPALSSKK